MWGRSEAAGWRCRSVGFLGQICFQKTDIEQTPLNGKAASGTGGEGGPNEEDKKGDPPKLGV